MWCSKCQADVSTEVSADGQSINCTNCSTEIRKSQTPSLHPEMRRARELIDQLSVDGAKPDPDSQAKPGASGTKHAPRDGSPAKASARAQPKTDERASAPNLIRKRSLRVDGPHPTKESGSHSPPGGSAASGDSDLPAPQRRQDEAHLAMAAPHFDLSAMPQKTTAGKAESIWGQLLAYGGVGVLTVGTALVLWGHFGGPAQYAPTGWLVATAGQMLLFLGVVTLISGGMQQTTQQVTSRVESIGSRMLRFEQTAEQLLRGPHFGREGQAVQKATGQGGDSAATS